MLEKIFTNAVHQCFDALAERYNLKEHSSTADNILSQRNEKICLDIFFDSRRSYELEVRISNNKSNSPHYWDKYFNLGLILKLRAPSGHKAVGIFQTSDPDFIPEAVKTFANLTETYATDLLEGNQNSFRELGIFQEIEVRKYNLEQELWYARKAVKKAWTSKDYVGVVKVYKPLEKNLTAAERKNFNMPRKW